ncbi:MAG: M48 family metallopeptidase [Solirubrobacteraceae bacterium]
MNSEIIFYSILLIISLNFLWEKYLNYLNYKSLNNPIPKELNDIYEENDYKKSQDYNKEKHKFSSFSSTLMFVLTLLFFLLDGFLILENFVGGITLNPIYSSIIYLFIIFSITSIIDLPFSYYSTFVVEEKFGFNKTTVKMFIVDKIKQLFLGGILGFALLFTIIWLYNKLGNSFWIYSWIIITVFSVFLNMFFSTLIVPLFNKQTHLEEGELKNAILEMAKKVGFKLNNIFVIDGSKRSTKANAYFAGFGPKKRIVLFDTLIKELSTEEIVAVLAHEIGHYKKKHIIWNLSLGIIQTGVILFLFSRIMENEILSSALSIAKPSFHVGLIVFSILFSPISNLLNWGMNVISRKFEYQADNFAKENYSGKHLISSLKVLSKKSFSNLTPNKLYVNVNYSHPSLLERIKNLEKIDFKL